MALNFGRTPGPATVQIDYEICTSCGLCAKVCSGGPLVRNNGKVTIDPARGFGCIACGHCLTICPVNCITVQGRDLTPADIVPHPPKDAVAGFDALNALMLARRSVRHYLPKEIEPEKIEKILQAASTAPMGVPPSEVRVLVANGLEKAQRFRADMLKGFQRMKFMFSPVMLWAMRWMAGKDVAAMMKEFMKPVYDTYMDKDKTGEDWFFYNAPLALHFYSSMAADPSDAIIASTYAVLAAESLGLGSCMLGFPGPILKYNPALRAQYGIQGKVLPGLCVIFGYPAVHHQRALRRRFADVRPA